LRLLVFASVAQEVDQSKGKLGAVISSYNLFKHDRLHAITALCLLRASGMYDSDNSAAVGITSINNFKSCMKNVNCFTSVSSNVYGR
jgi:hypothetical protein